MGLYTYPGNIHIHSTYSDGSGSVSAIAAAAASAGMRFVIITDHNTLLALGEEGYQQGVAVLAGVELNNADCHYLALGLSEMLPCPDGEPQKMIEAVAANSGLGFLAHPFEQGSRLIENGLAFPWTSWPVFGFTGLEIWNYSSHWRSRAKSAPRLLYWFLLNRKAAMDGPPVSGLKLWDCYTTAGHQVVAIGGTDAHAVRRKVAFVPVKIFSYRYLCRTINTYICLREPLSDLFPAAKDQIYSALKNGNCYVSLDQLHSGKGFSFTACRQRTGNIEALMGDRIMYSQGLSFSVHAPSHRAVIRLLRNGCIIEQKKGAALSFQPSLPGVYRAELYYCALIGKPRPWLYSNPIYLRSMK